MIKRFVKMQFRPEAVDEFKHIFARSRHLIQSFEGCRHVELLQAVDNPCIFFTFSLWTDEACLNAYRASAVFADVWGATKLLFSERPQAWSLIEPPLD